MTVNYLAGNDFSGGDFNSSVSTKTEMSTSEFPKNIMI